MNNHMLTNENIENEMQIRIINTQLDFYLDESNLLGVAAEALSAAVETILPDQSMGIPTHTAT